MSFYIIHQFSESKSWLFVLLMGSFGEETVLILV